MTSRREADPRVSYPKAEAAAGIDSTLSHSIGASYDEGSSSPVRISDSTRSAEDKTGRIAFIGAGSIGRPMAERLIECGRDLIVCDPSQAVRDHFSALGCPTTASPSDCADAGIVIFMVANDAQLRSAATGPSGLVPSLDASADPILLIMSTVLPETVIEIAAEAARRNARTIDAPVSGGSLKARDGTLSIMVSGDPADIDEARPVLDQLASVTFECGDLGNGQRTKILNNLVGVANLFLFAETMRIAQLLGMDLQRLADVMERSSGRNNGTKNWPARKGLFRWNSADLAATRSVVDVTRKDLHHALTLADRAGASTPLLRALIRGHDETSYGDVLERWSALASDDDGGTD
ncbi:NAD(P)-dependent oxidoreductase [Microvirga puerhi]|uniref:NAD(P)-dependent oxidoreductase n=1 Tax=Microvirga puerhi TaxID=2876078 RepID=A0ABS7VU16_9HYPH|nr:NAD(P)-dependent oxidoreductase [Microvirga puerhi]MBZ6079084.1 NAD(P)-dependent oxidoreductase [Microvirga puerhi]